MEKWSDLRYVLMVLLTGFSSREAKNDLVSGLSNWIDGGFRPQDGYSGKSSRFGKGKCWFGF